MSDNISFIVFSDNWGEHPSSCQHLFKRLAIKNLVLWVNTVGMRNPKFSISDLRKAYYKMRKMLRGSRQDEQVKRDGILLYVCQPFMLPFSSIFFIRKLNQYFVTRTVQRYARKLKILHPILVSTVPNACDYVGFFNEEKSVYYCVDDFAQWPGLERDLVREMEKKLVNKANLLVATSRKLYQKLLIEGKPIYLLTHGVDVNMFLRTPTLEHHCLNNIPKPRIGYFGLIDERNDQRLISALASEMKDYSFVMTGPIVTDVTLLKSHPNIYFTGPLSYTELPSLVNGFSALFIPYIVNNFTDSISPLKLKEYLITGKPVITTPLAEAHQYAQYITLADTVLEWRSAFEKGLKLDVVVRQKSILEWMQDETWENKAEHFLAFISK